MNSWAHAQKSDRKNFNFFFEGEDLVLRSVDRLDSKKMGAVKPAAEFSIYHGKRVKFSADFRTIETEGAGLWLTASTNDWHLTDGMYDSLIKGTTDWTSLTLVIDVPSDSTYLSYGMWMVGKGECRLKNPRFEVVDSTVHTTSSKVWDKKSSSYLGEHS